MSSPTRPGSADGHFGTVEHAAVGQGRRGGRVLRRWPAACHLQLDYFDQRYGGLVPAAVFDADGEEVDEDMERGRSATVLVSRRFPGTWPTTKADWAATTPSVGGLNQDRIPCVKLKSAAAMTLKRIGSPTGMPTCNPVS